MRARRIEATPENLAMLGAALRRGELVAMPTETVYGLAGAATDPVPLARIFTVKERPAFDPLIVHVAAGRAHLASLAEDGLVDAAALDDAGRRRADRLAAAFWPGPLTLVLPRGPRVPDLATSGLPTVAVRSPRHAVAQSLLVAAAVPLAAPSANRFGHISPTSAAAALAELGDRIDWVLDGGPCAVGVESTIVAIDSAGDLSLLRPGGTPLEAVAAAVGVTPARVATPAGARPLAPGMLESHYAPRKPLRMLPEPAARLVAEPSLPPGIRVVGLLVVAGDADAASRALARRTGREVVARTLSAAGDMEEAARNLFAALRELDASRAELLLCEPCPTTAGLGAAIADRLRRASAAARE